MPGSPLQHFSAEIVDGPAASSVVGPHGGVPLVELLGVRNGRHGIILVFNLSAKLPSSCHLVSRVRSREGDGPAGHVVHSHRMADECAQGRLVRFKPGQAAGPSMNLLGGAGQRGTSEPR